MKPLISVIIPVHNGDKYIAEAIHSVLAQTYLNWELIVVDDASTDRTCEIVKQIAAENNKVRLIECAENFGGPARPRNIGIQNSKGEFLTFLDDDDSWLPDKLEKQIIFLLEKKLDFVYTGITILGGKNRKVKPVKSWYSLMLKSPITTSSVLVKNSRNIWFDEDKQLIAAEDHHLWLHLLYDGFKIGFIPDPLTIYRIRETSISHSSAYKSILLYDYSVLKFIFARKIETYYIILVLLISVLKLLLIFPFRLGKAKSR